MKNAVLLMLSAALAVCPAIGAAAEAVEGEGMEAPGIRFAVPAHAKGDGADDRGQQQQQAQSRACCVQGSFHYCIFR